MSHLDLIARSLSLIDRSLPIAFAVLIVESLVNYIHSYRLLCYLKEKHFKKWEELGSPTLFINNSIKTGTAMSKFHRDKDYLLMGDPRLVKMCRRRNFLVMVHWVVFGACVLLIILSILLAKVLPSLAG